MSCVSYKSETMINEGTRAEGSTRGSRGEMVDITTLVLMGDLKHGLEEQMRGMEQMLACSATPAEAIDGSEAVSLTEGTDGSEVTPQDYPPPSEDPFDADYYMEALILAMSAMERNLSSNIDGSSERLDLLTVMSGTIAKAAKAKLEELSLELDTYLSAVRAAAEAARKSSIMGYVTAGISIAIGCVMVASGAGAGLGVAMIATGVASIVVQALAEAGIIDPEVAKWVNVACSVIMGAAMIASGQVVMGAAVLMTTAVMTVLTETGAMEDVISWVADKLGVDEATAAMIFGIAVMIGSILLCLAAKGGFKAGAKALSSFKKPTPPPPAEPAPPAGNKPPTGAPGTGPTGAGAPPSAVGTTTTSGTAGSSTWMQRLMQRTKEFNEKMANTSFGQLLNKYNVEAVLGTFEGVASVITGAFTLELAYYQKQQGDSLDRQGVIEKATAMLNAIADMIREQTEQESNFSGQSQGTLINLINDAGRTAATPYRALAHALLAG